jgi:hypothetical protein
MQKVELELRWLYRGGCVFPKRICQSNQIQLLAQVCFSIVPDPSQWTGGDVVGV